MAATRRLLEQRVAQLEARALAAPPAQPSLAALMRTLSDDHLEALEAALARLPPDVVIPFAVLPALAAILCPQVEAIARQRVRPIPPEIAAWLSGLSDQELAAVEVAAGLLRDDGALEPPDVAQMRAELLAEIERHVAAELAGREQTPRAGLRVIS